MANANVSPIPTYDGVLRPGKEFLFNYENTDNIMKIAITLAEKGTILPEESHKITIKIALLR